MNSPKIDQTDIRILSIMQANPEFTQRDVAEAAGLSHNACWRRLKQLEQSGVIEGQRVRLNRDALGLSLVVFSMIRTRSHSADWLRKFRAHVNAIPEITDFYRIGGDYDYLLKIVARDMAGFDRVYQRLIDGQELDAVTSYFAMEAIVEDRPIPL